jgi:Flp pilus assembly protein TadG
MTNILDAASSVMTPYATGSLLQIRISQIKIDATGKATVNWSDARNMTALTKGSTVTGLPSAVVIANTYLVTAEVHYAYTPTIGYVMTGSFDLKDQFYLRPRLSDCISRGSTYTCS